MFIGAHCTAQVAINTAEPNAAVAFEINSETPTMTYGGLKIPTVTETQRNTIAVTTASEGTMLFVTYASGNRCLEIYDGIQDTWQKINCLNLDPVLLAIQDFEVVAATPTLSYTDVQDGEIFTNTLFGTNSGDDTFIGNRSYGAQDEFSEVLFGPVDTSAYSSATLRFRLAAFSTTFGNGVDDNDFVDVYVYNQAATIDSYELEISGGPSSSSNFRYGFDANGTYSMFYDGDDIPIQINTLDGLDGFTYIEVTGLPADPALFVNIDLFTNNSSEVFVIDNVEIYGVF